MPSPVTQEFCSHSKPWLSIALLTPSYGDITADNTSERIGFVILFIVGAWIWGNLLAEVFLAAESKQGHGPVDSSLRADFSEFWGVG